MERIKKALDTARAEQAAAGTGPQNGRRAQSAETRSVVESEIRYSQTRVSELDSAVLRENNVIYGEADRKGLTAYKMLRTQVLQRMVAQSWNALAITSPTTGDGKTLTAINLAISLAREFHHTVLLVDSDLRNPSVHRYFGLEPECGIDDYLLNDVPLGEVLLNPGIERLVLLPARVSVENSSEILASPAMGNLVQELKTRYPSRLVLFDLPPILSADDALSFAPHVDAFLLVLRDAKTTREELTEALEILQNTPVIGTVLNASDENFTSYY